MALPGGRVLAVHVMDERMVTGGAGLGGPVDVLRASRVFVDLHADELAFLGALCRQVKLACGDVVFYVGEPGDTMFVVQEGWVDVLPGSREGVGEPLVVATLGPGEFFGEMSMLERRPRSATVRAKTDAILLALSTEDFYTFAKRFRNGFTVIVINIARMLSERLRETTGRLTLAASRGKSSGCA